MWIKIGYKFAISAEGDAKNIAMKISRTRRQKCDRKIVPEDDGSPVNN